MMKGNALEIILNDKIKKIPENTTIAQLIDMVHEKDKYLIVEHNGKFVFPQKYATTILSKSDSVEFVHSDFGG